MTTDKKAKELKGSVSASASLPETGFVRLNTVLDLIPVSRSTWFAHRGTRFPKPISLGPRITAYRVEDIRRLLEKGID